MQPQTAKEASRLVVGAFVLLYMSCFLGGCGGSSPAPTPAPPERVNAENCFLIDATPTAVGTEDVVKYTENILITGEVDFHTLWGDDTQDGDPLNAKPGDLLFINASDPLQPTMTRMNRDGFPEGVAYNPHGKYYLPEGNLLHVVNHAYTRGGERIDVFKIVDQDGIPEAEWQYAWTNDFFDQNANGVLNDLAVVDADHLFVTRYLNGEGAEGRRAGSSSQHYRDFVASGYTNGTTEFYYCTRNAGDGTSDCVVAGTNFGMANGINWGNNDKTLLYVNDIYLARLRAYSIDPDANNAWTDVGFVQLYQPADNIEWDQTHMRLFLGSIALTPGWGGADELIPDSAIPTSNEGLSTLVLDDGSKLPGISSANYANGNMFMGSHSHAGVLVCPTTLTESQMLF